MKKNYVIILGEYPPIILVSNFFQRIWPFVFSEFSDQQIVNKSNLKTNSKFLEKENDYFREKIVTRKTLL